jgi:hypothetical protein
MKAKINDKNYKETVVKSMIISLLVGAGLLGATILSLSYHNISASAQTSQQKTNISGSQPSSVSSTNNTNTTAIGTVKQLQKAAGNNTQIIMKNKDIGNPNATTLKGMEKSQMGNVIPGNQGTTFEGQQLSKLNSKNSTGK